MKALTWHGKRDVRVDTVPDPTIQAPTDAIVRITSTGLCGSDLHLYELFGPFIDPGDILGHEPMGIVEAIGAEVTHVKPGDRVVIPFNISCGHCWMCTHALQSQCETTQVHQHGTGASLFGYTKLYGQVPGGQAELLRVPQAQYGPIKVPDGPADDRYLYLSDVLPTAWQAVEYANVPPGGTVAVLGLGPIGQMSARIARHRGASQVFGIDLVPAHLAGIDIVRRGGTLSISGVYGGNVDPMPLLQMFDKQLTVRMGQANVKRWVDDLLPLLGDDDPLGVDDLATHHLPLEEAPAAYASFQKKQDGAIKVVFNP